MDDAHARVEQRYGTDQIRGAIARIVVDEYHFVRNTAKRLLEVFENGRYVPTLVEGREDYREFNQTDLRYTLSSPILAQSLIKPFMLN